MDINKIFEYQHPNEEKLFKYKKIRHEAKEFADLILKQVPDSHERDLSIDKLREVVMWANAAIALND